MTWGTQISVGAVGFCRRWGCGRCHVAEEWVCGGFAASDSATSRPSACGWLVKSRNNGLGIPYETHGAGVAIAVNPVGAVVGIEVLAPVLVKSAAARHGERIELGFP